MRIRLFAGVMVAALAEWKSLQHGNETIRHRRSEGPDRLFRGAFLLAVISADNRVGKRPARHNPEADRRGNEIARALAVLGFLEAKP